MKFTNNPMKFGIFMGPYHKPDLNPKVSIRQDLQTIVHLDELGYDEAWIGEHHSGGVETISSPELMIAAAAELTKHIKLGTGAITLPYHNPLMVADRIVQLDYMTNGRMMFGVAPGQLVKDATMIGLNPLDNRRRMQESLDAIIPLFKGETVTMKTDWFELKDACLQLLPCSDFEMATVSVISPSGPIIAGKYGMGMLSLAATDPVGVELLLDHWDTAQKEAAKYGHTVDRSQWRLMGPMHIAETFEKALDEVRYGLSVLHDYLAHINPGPPIDWFDLENTVNTLNENGYAVIGTPEMARAQIDRLIEKTGGFGTYLLMGIDWAAFPARCNSQRLFAEEVIPWYNGTRAPLRRSFNAVMATGYEGAQITAAAQQQVADAYQKAKR
ncbi:MAG: LLM class flavin-dependent oxidoreductase [Pseudomonadota bacterium]